MKSPPVRFVPISVPRRVILLLGLIPVISGCTTVKAPKESDWLGFSAVLYEHDLSLIARGVFEQVDSAVVIPLATEPRFQGTWDWSTKQQVSREDTELLKLLWSSRRDDYRRSMFDVPSQSFDTLISMLERAEHNQRRRPVPINPELEVGRLLGTQLVETIAVEGIHSYSYDYWSGVSSTTHQYMVRRSLYDASDGTELAHIQVMIPDPSRSFTPVAQSLDYLVRLEEIPTDTLALEGLAAVAARHEHDVPIQLALGWYALKAGYREGIRGSTSRLRRLLPRSHFVAMLQVINSAYDGNLAAFEASAARLLAAAPGKPALRQLYDALGKDEIASNTALAEAAGSLRVQIDAQIQGTDVRSEIDAPDSINEILPRVVEIKTALGSASGMIIARHHFILTNRHVVADQGTVSVIFSDGITLTAEDILLSDSMDAALIKVSRRNMLPVQLGESSDLEPGTPVYAVGNSLGLGVSVTRGIISSIHDLHGIRTIQTDAAINAGNSGGPLTLVDGTVIGMNSFKVQDVAVEGMGFAISADDLRAFVQAGMMELGD